MGGKEVWRVLRSFKIQLGQCLSVELSYRLAFFQSILSGVLGMAGVLMFWLAVARIANHSPVAASGYTSPLLIGYFVVASAMAILSDDGMSRSLSFDIRMGRLSAALVRPHPYICAVIARAIAFITVRVLVIAPVGTCILLLLPDLRSHLTQLDQTHWIAFVFAIGLGLLCGWAVKSMVGFLAFRLTQTWGPELIYLSLFALASGERFPPDVLPPWLLQAATWTPMYYMVGFPSLVFMGRIPADEIVGAFTRGGIVLSVTACLTQYFWRMGLKRFEAVGI